MHVLNYNACFSSTHLIFSELEDMSQHLDFNILYENDNEVIPITFYLQLLNKQ